MVERKKKGSCVGNGDSPLMLFQGKKSSMPFRMRREEGARGGVFH